MRKEFTERGEPQRRAGAAVGVLFMGVVVALLIQAKWGDRAGILQTGMDIGVGLLVLAMLGWPPWKRIIRDSGNASSLFSRLGIGVIGGCVGFAFAWVYLFAVLSLVGGDVEGTPVEVPWWTVVILAPVVEEWLLRGVAWEALRRIGPQRTVLFGTALLFAMMHGLGGGGWLEFPHRFVGGLVLGMVRIRTGALWPCVLAHFVWNGLAVYLLD